jgi:hypothetical protein
VLKLTDFSFHVQNDDEDKCVRKLTHLLELMRPTDQHWRLAAHLIKSVRSLETPWFTAQINNGSTSLTSSLHILYRCLWCTQLKHYLGISIPLLEIYLAKIIPNRSFTSNFSVSQCCSKIYDFQTASTSLEFSVQKDHSIMFFQASLSVLSRKC